MCAYVCVCIRVNAGAVTTLIHLNVLNASRVFVSCLAAGALKTEMSKCVRAISNVRHKALASGV